MGLSVIDLERTPAKIKRMNQVSEEKADIIINRIKDLLELQTNRRYFSVRHKEDGTYINDDLHIYLDTSEEVYPMLDGLYFILLDASFNEDTDFEKEISHELLCLYKIDLQSFKKILQLDR